MKNIDDKIELFKTKFTADLTEKLVLTGKIPAEVLEVLADTAAESYAHGLRNGIDFAMSEMITHLFQFIIHLKNRADNIK